MVKIFARLAVFLISASITAFGQSQPGKANAGPDYSKEAFVLEQSADKFKYENDGTYMREMHLRIRIQSDAGVQHFSVVKFAYQKLSQIFAIDYVRVTKPDGTVVVSPPDTFQDMPADITREAPFYTDTHETHVAVKGLGVGDLLEYQARWQQNKPLIPGQFWLDYNFAHEGIVLQEVVEMSVPRGRAVKLKSSTIKPVTTESSQYEVYTWTSSNLENKDDKKEKQEQQETGWRQVRGRQPLPEIELSSFKNWEELGDWYQTLQRDRVQPSAEIQAKAAELTKGLTDENTKIHALYDFVSTKYRYIGIAFGLGRYQPHTADEVLANEYGDCKDKHTLFASLLNASGIKAYPALISTTHEIDADVPSPGQFNHVITVIPQATGFLWLDTTTEVAPFALLMTPLRDKHALVIADGKAPALVATPADDPFPTLQKFEMQATLSDAGVLDGKAENTDRGDTELLFRAAFRIVPQPQWKDLVQRVSYGLGFGGDVSNVNIPQPDKTTEPFRFTYDYKRKDYSDWANRRISPPLPRITLPEVDDEITATVPIWLGSPGEIDFQGTLELPKGYSPDLQKAVHIKRDFADYDATYSFKSGVITAERHLLIKLREVPVVEYAEYKSFRKAVEDDYAAYTSLSTGRSASTLASYQEEIWNLPMGGNAEANKFYKDAQDQYQRNDTQAEIASVRQAVEVDPKFVRAWLWLGEIYRATRQNDLALEAYRKAVEIDPDQVVSYKALGFMLSNLGKTEEALPVWQQLIKVAPEKVDGYANLGIALVYLKRYREAVSSLESAVKLSPDWAPLQLTLGNAYLNTGDMDKSRSAFETALKLDSTPAMLNEISYSLAERNTDLDKAKEYAEKAVLDEEEASTAIQLSGPQTSDLDHARRLTMFWDTLGWVNYRLNDLVAAEGYLKAAWTISQSPVIGRHLGEVYEHQKKTAAALHMYELAYSATPSLPVLPRPTDVPVFKKDASALEQDIHRLGGKPESSAFIDDLNHMRTFKLPRIVSGTATAEFLLLIEPGGKAEAKFISGSDSLKGIQKALESTSFNLKFPDDHPTRILRRGIVGCYQYTGCSFVLIPPNAVFSVQ
jgi:tetratricopeptide (TPR) repeat protein/transglutaminase-like putative cysteine protease